MRPALLAEGRRRQSAAAAAAKDKNSGVPSKHDTRALLARYCELSPRTFDKALAVIQAAQNNPDQFAGAVEQLDRTGNVDRAFHAVIFAELGRDRGQAPIFKEIAIGRRRLGSYSARELGWLIGFFGELSKHFDRRATGYAHEVFSESAVRRVVGRAERFGRLPPKRVCQKHTMQRRSRHA